MKVAVVIALLCCLQNGYGRSLHRPFRQAANSSLIEGGEEVTIDQYPFAAYLFVFRGPHYELEHCGGSALNTKVILTAAHCVWGPVRYVTIVVGLTSISQVPPLGAKVVYHSDIILINPDYNQTVREFDAALIGVLIDDTHITFKKAKLPGRRSPPPQTSYIVTLIGWGWTSLHNPGMSDKLRAVEIPVYDHAKCANDYWPERIITRNIFCAGYVGTHEMNGCYGDSGGPVLDVRGVQIGIIQGGRCGDINQASLHILVASVRRWIRTTSTV